MAKIKWVLTDCFDTILLRKNHPDDIKRKWAKHMAEIFQFRITPNEIYEIRRSVERFLIQRCKLGEFRCDELYEEILKRIYIKNCDLFEYADAAEWIQKMYQLEFKVESASLSLNEEYIKKLKDIGLPIAVVSEYYMDESFLWSLFHYFGISELINRIFLSCEYRCNKHDGNLYRYVIEELGVPGDDMIMFGDNKTLDIDNAAAHGIKGTLINNAIPYRNQSIEEIEKQIKNILYQDKYKENSFANYATTFYLFIERLYKKCVSYGINDIYFLSREGEMLKKMFDCYIDGHETKITSHYLYVSRQATSLAGLMPIEEETFNNLHVLFKSTSVTQFLRTIGFTEKKIESLQNRIKLNFEDEKEDLLHSEDFTTIKQDAQFIDTYNQTVANNRKLFEQYLRQEHFFDNNRVALVDVGWNGTIQNNIAKFAENGQTLYGFYCGLVSGAAIEIDNRKEGLLFSDAFGKSENYDIWSFDCTFFERILTASHAPTIGYRSENGIVKPIMKEYVSETESYNMLNEIQNLLLNIFVNVNDVICSSVFSAEDFYVLFKKIHIDTLLCLGIHKAKFQQKLYENQVENFGLNVTVKEKNKKVFGVKQIIKKMVPRIKLIKNTEIMIKVCAQNKLYFLIPVFAGCRRKIFLKYLYV